jgi:membrane protein
LKADIKRLIHRFIEDDVLALASQLAYSLILSFFPFLIFLLTLVGYSSIKSGDVLQSLQTIMPKNAFELITTTVVEIVDSRKGDLLSFSAIITIWAGSGGFRAVIKGLNKAYDEKETRAYWRVILLSIICMLALAVIVIFSFSLLVFGEMIGDALINWLGLSNSFKINWDIFRYAGTLIAMTFVFAAIYHFTPCRRLKWMEVMPGAAFCTLGWLLSSLGFAYYVNNINNYSRIYGGIGAVIVLMLWLFITSVIILLGGEINAVLAFDREIKAKKKFL